MVKSIRVRIRVRVMEKIGIMVSDNCLEAPKMTSDGCLGA